MPRGGSLGAAAITPVDRGGGARHAVRPASRAVASEQTVGSVVVPAHNEASVIGRGLDRLFHSLGSGIDVVVVCNGCTDGTADVARGRGHPLRVVELETASKEQALRGADRIATAFPRVYLDADVLVSGATVRAVLEHLGRPGALAARPPIAYDTSSSSHVVRRFYRARAQVPAVMGSLWGAGLYALSAEGRARFDEFPLRLADDLFVDRLFSADEIELVDTDPVIVVAPATVSGLLATFRRTFRRNRAMKGVVTSDRPGTRATVRDLLRFAGRGPNELVDAAVYAMLVVAARLLAWRHPEAGDVWERDHTSRR